ncbi:D-alanyl-D-alanine carboxypeptidase [Streptomyces sp. NL15-2K]|uniref:D-alanyl-D-alanine carboxypeptidase n=1 Tax=Streptomyces sp. NL15-2K TaxID=376149 RepID=UPI000F58D95F|nr:D-alanyl-D-alanine carboxypeptidase [Streptomyces sp. NL15-2K]
MAGESPDRSKQRESSAEPTSGSAGQVPEARSDSPERRDPRLAVARESGPSTTSGGVDTATRVFSVRDLTTDQETPPQDSTGAQSGPQDATGAETPQKPAQDATGAETAHKPAQDATEAETAHKPAQDATEAETGAQDAAGAEPAGVATKDAAVEAEERGAAGEDTDTDADGRDAADTDTDADADGRDAAGADADADADADEQDTAGTDTDTDADADGRDTAGADSDTDAPDTAGTDTDADADTRDAAGADSDTDKPDTAETAAEPQDGNATGQDTAEPEVGEVVDLDAAETAADEATNDAAEPETEQDATDSPAEQATRPDTEPQDEEPAQNAEEPQVDEATGQDAAEAAADEATKDSAEPEDGAALDEVGANGDARLRDAVAAWVASADEEPEADSGDAGEVKADGGEEAEGATDTGAEAEAEADRESPSDAETEAADAEPDDKPSATDKPAVDQPTTTFKAVRPPAPAVDQPTTMLKLGDAAKDAKDTKDGEDGRTPEADVERTSKFVALKPLDDPATRKPKADAPADATAPFPHVGPERTTQQPLPPKPPLDLLAELTNTPPPPETPVRTLVRRVKIWTPLVLLLAVVFAIVQAVRPLPTPSLDLTAKDSYTFEGNKVDIPWPSDGQAALDVQGIGTFGSSGEQKAVPIASVAKVMTAYVILRDHPLKSGAPGPKIEIDQAAEDQSDAGQESTVDVTKGDTISQREALESILIASANNVARLLARWDAGSEKSFVEKMNAAADDLGMTNTTYTDPSGLNNTTVSTAVDQVKLAKAAMKQPAFREVATMMSYVDYKGTKHNNWNQLVGYNDVVGIKTGTTTSALGNLVFAAKKEVGGETRTIVGAVVRQPAGGSDNTILQGALSAGDRLIRAAQGALETATILKKGDVVGYADDGLGGRTPVVVTKDVTAVGWADLTVKLTFAADDLPHTAKAGTPVGSLTVGDGSGSAVKVPVALQKDLVEPGFTDKLTRLG